MPTPAESLTIRSDGEERQRAISDCISQLIQEGRSQEQAIALCQSQADKSMGTRTRST